MILPSVDSLFMSQAERDMIDAEKVEYIDIDKIKDFPNHPFKVVNDDKMQELASSVKEYGVILPIMVRPKEDGTYEIVSGHRRKMAAQIAGLKDIKCIVKDLTDDEATIIMVDSNIQREEILPSERAFAYKMKLEAMKHQGIRNDLTSRPVGDKLSTEVLGEEVGESARQIQRYIRLTELIPEILQMVDDKKVAFRPAVELSYLSEENQYVLLNIMEFNECTPSLAQAIRLKKLEQEGNLTEEKLETIMEQEKPNQKEQIKFGVEKIQDYFPKGYTQEQMENKIKELLEKYKLQWQRKLNERNAR
ncbi:MAG: ParB/RepB/Spo0J family partition protein [Clostridia bacterium]|nr:ParB/RepB/Spo0J family partition protein [Clostridia bacterium]